MNSSFGVLPRSYLVSIVHARPEIPVSGVGTHMTTLIGKLKNHHIYGRLYLSEFVKPSKPIRAGIRALHLLCARNHAEYWMRRELLHVRTQMRFCARDIVHCHCEPALWAVGPAARAAGAAVVCTVHGLQSLHVREHWRDRLDGPGREIFECYDRLEREAYGCADHLIAVDSNHKRLLIERGCEEERISVIYNAVDIDYVDSQRDLPTGLVVPRQYILAARRLDPKNGIEVLLKAARLMKSKIGVVVAGYGPLESELRSLAVELGLQDRIIFLGRVSLDTVLRLTWNATACAVPSVPVGGTIEATSLAAIEGMAAGRLVVASRIGGLQEIIRDGETGYLTTPGDFKELALRLDAASNDAAVRASIGARAREFVLAHLTAEGWFRQHLEVYDRVFCQQLAARADGRG